jgi:hypothetical protein
MAAFGASAVKATNVKVAKTPSQNDMQTIATQTFSFVIPASSTVASATLTNFSIPRYSYLVGYCVTHSATLGSTTLAFTTVTQNVIWGAAATYTAATVGTVASGLNLITGSVDDTLSVTTAAATSPSSDVTVTVTLILASYGNTAGLTTYSI